MLLTALAANALTPAQVLDKAYSALTKSKGVSASYTLTVSGQRQAGKIESLGNKFHISAGGLETWYDGKTQWNYNSRNKEVTISTPTPSEVASVSPYAMISSYKTLYSLQSLTSKIPGTYAIRLLPKNGKSPIKSAIIYVRSSDFQPCRLDVTSRDGAVSSVAITSIKTGQNFSSSAFTFQKSKYPNTEVIDLR